MATSESGTQLLARLGARPSLRGLEKSLFGTGPEAGSVFEFYGGEGTGKTEMILHLIAKCILPEAWRQLYLGGKNTGVVVVDTDFKFPLFRLAVIMESLVKAAIETDNTMFDETATPNTDTTDSTTDEGQGSEFSDDDIESFIHTCLTKLHILLCGSSFQLLMSLTSLESLISNNPYISVIIVDSISAYYWMDKARTPDRYQAIDTAMKPIISALSNYVTNYNMVLICVKSALFFRNKGNKTVQGAKGDNSPLPDFSFQSDSREPISDHCEFLGRTWNQFVTKRFIFTQSAINQAQTFNVKFNNDGQISNIKFKTSDSGIEFLR